MKFSESLKSELETIAPNWNWSCADTVSEPKDAISAKMVAVSAANKNDGACTLPIHVAAYPNANALQVAKFICDVLMIRQSSSAELLTNPAKG